MIAWHEVQIINSFHSPLANKSIVFTRAGGYTELLFCRVAGFQIKN